MLRPLVNAGCSCCFSERGPGPALGNSSEGLGDTSWPSVCRFFCGSLDFVVGGLLVARDEDVQSFSKEAGVGLAVMKDFLRKRAGLGADATLGEVALAAGILLALLAPAALLLTACLPSPQLLAQDLLQWEGLAGGPIPPWSKGMLRLRFF